MFVASCNFKAGEGCEYLKGQEIKPEHKDLVPQLLKENLVEELEGEEAKSHEDPKPPEAPVSAVDKAEAEKREAKAQEKVSKKKAK